MTIYVRLILRTRFSSLYVKLFECIGIRLRALKLCIVMKYVGLEAKEAIWKEVKLVKPTS